MSLRVYNTMSRRLEEFKPLSEGKVSVYVCGMTVYDNMHIGHARTYVAFDVILRYLKHSGYKVRYIQNITDIDDKIINRARERDTNPMELSREYAEKALKDQEALGLMKADEYPKVSETIPDIINAAQTLISKGHAYVVNGSVYFSVSSADGYGKLSNQDIEQLNRHRIDPDPEKKDPLDFALWKRVPDGEHGFESPWGYGRPGWHIECSVMSKKHLGDSFDIHGGALDLIFPHHENEVAQSEALTGKKPFVKYWMHTGFLNSSGEKMSKSLGNILSVREFLDKHSKDAFRLFILQSHYRSPVDYGEEKIHAAESALSRLRNFRKNMLATSDSASENGSEKIFEIFERFRAEFNEAMDDDFDTPKAISRIFTAVKDSNTLLPGGTDSRESLRKSIEILDELAGVIGLNLVEDGVTLTDVEEELIERRKRLRDEKNWAESDRIRGELAKRGLRIIDKSDGLTIVERI
ncbi:MAG: cysteine--tRNA ligase [Candidatus Altiarchaeota archaeon]